MPGNLDSSSQLRGNQSPIASAKEFTFAAVERRAKLYRTQVILAVALLGATAVTASFLGLAAIPIGAAMLTSMVGAYLLLDWGAVGHWQSLIWSLWWDGMSLRAFSIALLADPVLPRRTIASMLQTLSSSEFAEGDCRSEAQKREMTVRFRRAGSRQAWRTAIGAFAVQTCLCGTAALLSPLPALVALVAGSAALVAASRIAGNGLNSVETGQIV